MKINTSTQENLFVKRTVTLVSLILVLGQSFAFAGENNRTGNNSSYSNGINDNGFLPPIVWTPLKGNYSRGISYLSWSSLQESNSSHFEIERSNDGVNFYYVGKVMAQTSSDKVVSYNYNDAGADEGMNYYRVHYFDKDDHFQYSNTIILNVLIKGINITAIYPAPFTDKMNVTVASEVKTTASIQLFDNTGKVLISQQPVLNKGVTTLAIDRLEGLAKGMYIIKVQAGETIVTKKLIK